MKFAAIHHHYPLLGAFTIFVRFLLYLSAYNGYLCCLVVVVLSLKGNTFLGSRQRTPSVCACDFSTCVLILGKAHLGNMWLRL